MFRLLIFIACGLALSCEKRSSPPEAPPTHAPLERADNRPDIVDGSPLDRLVLHGRCYASDTHVLCANDHRLSHWEFPKIILVGQSGVLQMTELERLETRGEVRGMRFTDEERFASERGLEKSLLETIPAPAYVNDGSSRFLKCGDAIIEFEPMTSAQSRSWLEHAEIRLSSPAVTVSAMQTDDGIVIAEVTREGGGEEKSTELHIGPIDAMRRVQPAESNVVLDQGYREFVLDGGGRIHYPLNARMPMKDAPAKTLPDGSKVARGQALRQPFEWATYRTGASTEPSKLRFVESETQKKLEARFGSEPEEPASPACSVVRSDQLPH